LKQDRTRQRIDLANHKQSLGTMGDLLRGAGICSKESSVEHVAEVSSSSTVANEQSGPPFSKDRIRIRLERKHRGGKTVTLIEGLPSEPEKLTEWLKQLKCILGCGGTIENGAVVLQGDMRDRVRVWMDKHAALL
jgi:translation initiation factor 1